MLIKLNKYYYDPFIDFLKGVSILLVVLTHCLPLQDYILFSLWGDQAVPLFLLIQVFHAYKKGDINIHSYFDLYKLFSRILLPFLILLGVQITLKLVFINVDYLIFLKNVVRSGGVGPGSYYVWVYLQFFIILPVFLFVIKKISSKYILSFFLLLSIISEVVCCYVNIPSWLYRLFFIRYLFLIYLGYKWVIDGGINISMKTIILSTISIMFILLFNYGNVNMEPIFYNNDWKIFHWISYFYVAYIFVFILYKFYIVLMNYKTGGGKTLLCLMGKYSYEIFLVQMFVFTFYPENTIERIIGSTHLAVLIRIFTTTMLSIVPVLVYKKYFTIKNKNHV